MFEHYWYASGSAGPGPGPNPPDPGQNIGQSLRIRAGNGTSGTPVLNRPVVQAGNRSWTWSGWVKYSFEIFTLFTPRNSTGASSGLWMANQLWFQTQGTNQADAWRTDGVLRDESAWYHVVFSVDQANNRTRGWLNGVLAGQDNVVNNTYMSFNGTMGFQHGQRNNCSGDGYVADVYLIDNQVLEPTAFGRENSQGVWVPREVDFTPAEMRFSDFLTVDGPTDAGKGPEAAFDGLFQVGTNNNSFKTTGPGRTATFAPVPDIEFDDTLRVLITNSPNAIEFNGTTISPATSQQWNTVVASGGGTIGVGNELVITNAGLSGGAVMFSAIEVDGEILTNPFIWSADLFTSTNTDIDVDSTDTNFAGGSGPEFAFDNDTSLAANTTATTNSSIVFRPATQLTGVTSIDVNYSAAVAGTVAGFNGGNETNAAAAGWNEIYNGAAINIDNIYVRNASQSFLAGIRINGQILTDGVNNSYGPNGFHLDFSDPNDLGADRSGNGNDFTATGFNTDPVGIFSNQLQPGTGGFSGVLPRTNAFDGNPNTTAATVDNTTLTFSPITPIPFTQLEVAGTMNGGTYMWNGNSVAPAANFQFVTVFNGAGEISAATPLVAEWPGNAADMSAVRINGTTVLVDNTGTDYDLMQDSPTQNYATLNPLVPANLSLSNANLETSYNAVNIVGNTTIAVRGSGRYYWEINPDFSTNYNVVGIGAPGATDWIPGPSIVWTSDSLDMIQDEGDFTVSNNTVTTPYVTGDVLGWALDLDNNRCEVFQNGTSRGTFDIDVGDSFVSPIVGNSNASPTTQSDSINYGQQPFLYTPPDGFSALQTQNLPAAPIPNGRDHFQAITGPGDGGNTVVGGIANYAALVTDSTNVCSTDDPGNSFDQGKTGDTNWSATIFNGAAPGAAGACIDFFNPVADTCVFTITLPDNFTGRVRVAGGGSTGAVGRVTLSSGETATWDGPGNAVTTAVWSDWTTASAGFNTITLTNDTVGGGVLLASAIEVENVGVLVDVGILAAAQSAFPNGLWWIKDRANSNQHQLVSSINGTNETITTPQIADASNYDPPNGNSVAWCWNCPDAFTPACSETLVEARRNAAAGFSMVRLTTASSDPATAETFEHGLNAPPALVMTQRFLPGGGSSFMRVWSDQLAAGQAMWLNSSDSAGAENNTVATSTTNTVVNYLSMGDNVIPNADLIFFNFAPVPGYSAFGSYEGNSDVDGPFVYTGFRPAWVLIKNTAGGNSWRVFDSTRDPFNGAGHDLMPNSQDPEGNNPSIDFLSNGFKLRTTRTSLNGASRLIYAAFAEMPTGGSNTSPGNAR